MTRKPKTIGSITRAIRRTHRHWETTGRTRGQHRPRWYDIVQRHITAYGRQRGQKTSFAGPFGLRCAFIVTVGRKQRELEIHNSNGWQIGRRNYKQTTGEFKTGSIGAINSMNFELEILPPNTTLDKIFA